MKYLIRLSRVHKCKLLLHSSVVEPDNNIEGINVYVFQSGDRKVYTETFIAVKIEIEN